MSEISIHVIEITSPEHVELTLSAVDAMQSFCVMRIDVICMFAMHYKRALDERVKGAIEQVVMPHNGPIMFTVSGLYRDSREVYEVPEVQQLAVDLGKAIPDLICAPNLDTSTRQWLLCAEVIGSVGMVQKVRERKSKSGAYVEDQLLVVLPADARKQLYLAKQMLEGPVFTPLSTN